MDVDFQNFPSLSSNTDRFQKCQTSARYFPVHSLRRTFFIFAKRTTKKAANLFQDLLLFVPLVWRLFGCNRRAVHSELKQCLQQRFHYVVLGFLVVLPIDTGGVPYRKALYLAFRITTLQKAWNVYSICSLYSSVQVIEIPPFLHKGLCLVDSCYFATELSNYIPILIYHCCNPI